MITVQVHGNLGVRHEAWTEVMDMLPDFFLCGHVVFHVHLAANGDLRELSVDVEGEGTKLADVDAFSACELFVEVRIEGLPDDQHLSFGLEGLLVSVGANSWVVVLTREVTRLFESVLNDVLNAHVVLLLHT